MKSKNKTSPKTYVVTMEETSNLIRATIKELVDPRLLKVFDCGGSKSPLIQWHFGLTNTDQDSDQYELTLNIRSGAFGENLQEQVRRWWLLKYVTREEVVNALFHALTWDGSPYYWGGKCFDKRAEIM